MRLRRVLYSMKPWLREDTRDWIAQLELRVEDINYYLNETVSWLENHEEGRDEVCFACAMMTLVWVAYQRSEPITRWELMEILGVKDFHYMPDEELELGELYRSMDLENVLESILSTNWLNQKD